jgi:uncharacterized membrane protein YhaH (DUF805 family)
MSMPKWAKADPDIVNATAIASKATYILFIFPSFFNLFDEVQKKATGFRRLHDAQPSWLKSIDLIVGWHCSGLRPVVTVTFKISVLPSQEEKKLNALPLDPAKLS